jgi:hypothetical protein
LLLRHSRMFLAGIQAKLLGALRVSAVAARPSWTFFSALC